MAPKNLVIVESSTKASAIAKYLNASPALASMGGFAVMASGGHVRQIPPKPAPEEGARHGVVMATWKPRFEVIESKKATVSRLKKAAAEAERVFLAADPDREGEAIAWHLAAILKQPVESARRIVYHEITASAVVAAVQAPRRIDMKMVRAQNARQIMDRLVGYEVSPLVFNLTGPNSSAGRVQSAALRLVVERAEALERVDWAGERHTALAGTFALGVGGPEDKLDTVCRTAFASAGALFDAVDAMAAARPAVEGRVESVEAKPELEHPPPPFTTSSLQQAAHKALRFSPKETMRLAQALFEGGHITYMRTDSVALCADAVAAIVAHVRATYGDAMVHERQARTRAANAQEAHEAIRPTVPGAAPAIEDAAQARLYDLIQRRTLATQMAPAGFDTLAYAVAAASHRWTGTARRLVRPGWKVLYRAASAAEEDGANAASALPPVKAGDRVRLTGLSGGERLPPAPAMFTEATLVKAMEDAGIGRPSTYAATLDKLQEREYVRQGAFEGPAASTETVVWKAPMPRAERKRATQAAYAFKDVLVPTDKGRNVMVYLRRSFANLVDLNFTSSMEAALDQISSGSSDLRTVMASFWESFEPQVAAARATAPAQGSGGGGRFAGDKTFEGGWTAFEGKFGPTLRGPPPADGGKSRFVGLDHYLAATGGALDSLAQADVDFMTSLPRALGEGHSLCSGPRGFYVKGPSVNGDVAPALVKQGTALTLSAIATSLSAKLQRFQIGSQAWVARDGQNGPFLQGPPTEANPDKPHYVDLKYYLESKRKTIATLTHDDVRLLSCLPRSIGGGVTLGVGQYGFYARGADGKYKNLSDDLAGRIDTLTLIDIEGMPRPPPRAAPSSASSASSARATGAGGKSASAKSKGAKAKPRKAAAASEEAYDDDD